MTLVYCGAHQGHTLSALAEHFNRIIAFEANPIHYAFTKARFSFHPNFEIYNYVVDKENKLKSFNITSNNGESSSLSDLSDTVKGWGISVIDSVQVESINIYNFLIKKGIDFIDLYVSDIQGYDLTALTTLKPFLDAKRITMIQCEVEKNEREPMYKGPVNKYKEFDKLLSENYDIAWELDTPDAWLELDVRWHLKGTDAWNKTGLLK